MALKTFSQSTSKTTAVDCNSYKSFLLNTVSLTDVAGADFSFVVNCDRLYPDSNISLTPEYAAAQTGFPAVVISAVSDFSFTVNVKNIHASEAFNAPLGIRVVINN